MTVIISSGATTKDLGSVWDIMSYPDGTVNIATKDKNGVIHSIEIRGVDSQGNNFVQIMK